MIELQTGEIEGLLFQASTLESRGRAGKTYTIEIPKTSRNIELLGDVWAVHELNYLKFAATLRTEWTDIPGTLILDDFNYHRASGQFVFGVGMIGSELDGVMLRDIDFSELDHNLSGLEDSFFDGTEKYVYDLGQRGTFKETRVAIDELYPAYNCKELLRIILKDYAPDLSEVDDTVHWLFTEDYEFRNDPQWKRNAVFVAEETLESYSLDGELSGPLNWEEEVSPTEVSDPGGNYSVTVGLEGYTVPETGTYRFIAKSTGYSATLEDNTGSPVSFTYNSVANRLLLSWELQKNGAAWITVSTVVTITGSSLPSTALSLDTYLVECTAGDEIRLFVRLEGVMTVDALATTAFTADLNNIEFYNELSRYYGSGSNVQASELLPDIQALDFVALLMTGMNLMMYGDAITGEIKIVNQANKGSLDVLELREINQTINHRSAFQLVFDNDDAARLPDKITTQVADYGDVYQIDLGVARLGVGYVVLFNVDNLPILILNEEEWRTKMNYRLAKLTGTVSASIEVQKFSATGAAYYEIIVAPQWEELNYSTLFADSVTRGVRMIEGIGKFLPDLLTVDRYIYAVDVRDKNTGETLGIGYIIEAEQLDGDNYRYTLMI